MGYLVRGLSTGIKVVNNCHNLADDSAFLLFYGVFGSYFQSLEDDLSGSNLNKQAIASMTRMVLTYQDGRRWHDEFHADLHLAACRAADLHEMAVDSFFSVAPRDQLTRNGEAIPHLLTLHLDVDHYSLSVERQLIAEGASALVSSGRGLHAYWFLDSPAPARERQVIRSLNRQLADTFDGDFNATDVGRILRIPGTFNCKKPDHPKLVKLIECDPKRRYSLDDLIARYGVEVTDAIEVNETSDGRNAHRGRFLGPHERYYVARLLRDGLFERSSRNDAILLLGRYCLEQGMTKDNAKGFITGFFANNHNGLSKDWNQDQRSCLRHIEAAVESCWKQVPKWLQKYHGRQTAFLRQLSGADLEFIESLEPSKSEREFLIDAMTFILNYRRDNVIILEKRQMEKFKNCHSRNYPQRYGLLEEVGILRLKNKHKRGTRLGTEFDVFYRFNDDETQDIQNQPAQAIDLSDLKAV